METQPLNKEQVKRRAQQALHVLGAIDHMFNHNSPVSPGALLLDDDRTIQDHVQAAMRLLMQVVLDDVLAQATTIAGQPRVQGQ